MPKIAATFKRPAPVTSQVRAAWSAPKPRRRAPLLEPLEGEGPGLPHHQLAIEAGVAGGRGR
ncbi:hypothetical protein [Streptomyces sp. WAC 04229]|uniref:hypothetical protein n=1 Tax=Streptomyces sp. WAC 04229 TaxID=2203206 RepID=UPI003D73E1FA